MWLSNMLLGDGSVIVDCSLLLLPLFVGGSVFVLCYVMQYLVFFLVLESP